jgi:hypothetical protein
VPVEECPAHGLGKKLEERSISRFFITPWNFLVCAQPVVKLQMLRQFELWAGNL